MNKSNTPSRHVMALVTFLSLVPLVYFIPGWISPYLPESKLLNVVVSVGVIVPIISYLVLPNVIRLYQAILPQYLLKAKH